MGDAVFRTAVFVFDFGVATFAADDFFFGTFGVSSGVSFGVGFGEVSSFSVFFDFPFGDGEGELCVDALCFLAGDSSSSDALPALGFGEDAFALVIEALCFAAGGDSSGSGVWLGFGFGRGVGETCFFVAFLIFGFGVGVGDSSAEVTARAFRIGTGFSASSRCALTPTVAMMRTARTKETKRRTAPHANRGDRAINPERFRGRS